jgi:nitrate reductase delta subunit
VPAPPGQLATARQAASLLLGYPDEELLGRVGALRAAVAPLPAGIAGPLGRFLDHLETTPLARLQSDYVDTFDLRRRCCLYLTYFTCGDTRKRGMALLKFKHLYGRAGMELSDAELPDHLAVVLEFTALGDAARGERLLHEHRAGLELIRLALEEARSPYLDVLLAVCATLPPVAAADREAALRLAQEGPPSEEVGLEPYGPGSAFPPGVPQADDPMPPPLPTARPRAGAPA